MQLLKLSVCRWALACGLLCWVVPGIVHGQEAAAPEDQASVDAPQAGPGNAVEPLISDLRLWADPLDETGSQIAHYYFNRSAALRIHDSGVIPFSHPGRPTVQVRVGDQLYPMLFDTGTYCCIFQADSGWALPAKLRYSGDPAPLATLEAKLRQSPGGQSFSSRRSCRSHLISWRGCCCEKSTHRRVQRSIRAAPAVSVSWNRTAPFGVAVASCVSRRRADSEK